MEAREAVSIAKQWVSEVFSEEGISNLGLEEIRRDEATDDWLITIGFSRSWHLNRTEPAIAAPWRAMGRSYKVVRIRDSDATVVSMTDRENIVQE